MSYGTVQERRANLGVGIVEANRQVGISERKYGVGLWCQNRPEWQLTGTRCSLLQRAQLTSLQIWHARRKPSTPYRCMTP